MFIFCMTYITGGKLQSENNFYEKFDMHLLGVIRKAESKGVGLDSSTVGFAD